MQNFAKYSDGENSIFFPFLLIRASIDINFNKKKFDFWSWWGALWFLFCVQVKIDKRSDCHPLLFVKRTSMVLLYVIDFMLLYFISYSFVRELLSKSINLQIIFRPFYFIFFFAELWKFNISLYETK